MSRYDLNQYPYYDDFDSNKGYQQLLANPGRVAQAREFTQAQSVVKSIIKSIGDSLMRDGNVIEGCQVAVAQDKQSVTVSSGKVYMDGAVLPVAETTLAITGSGIETIGVIINDTIVTVSDDNSLRDPAQGFENYNLPGCDRLKRELQVVVNDPDAAVISVLNEGDLQLETYSPEYDTLTQTLARRTFDESGSYIVRGLSVNTEDNADPAYYTVVVEAGKAYVLGYELGVATPRRIPVERSTEYDLVTVNSFFYVAGTQDYRLDDDLYVRDIVSVDGVMTHLEALSRTNVGVQEDLLLSETGVIAITKVAQGTDTIYTQGTDYILVHDGSRHYLRWLANASASPAQGEQFNVTYTYTHRFVNNRDYRLAEIDGSHYLHWILNGADFPLNNTNFTVKYNQYLARMDLVYIDQYGSISVKKGLPAEYGFEEAPEVPMDTLPLAVITSPPNGSVSSTSSTQKINTKNVGLQRFTMQDIQEMLNRIRTLEYDGAVAALNNDAEKMYIESEKKGVLTDPFVDLTRCDLTYNLTTTGDLVYSTQPIFSAAIDVEMNLAYLEVNEKYYDLSVNASSTTALITSRLAMLGKTGEVVVLEQLSATNSYLINPYSMYPGTPQISISPAVDFWIEEKIIEVPVSLTKNTIVSTSTKTLRSSVRIHKVFKKYTKTSTSTKLTEVGTTTETYTSDSVISEEMITYCRQREIAVSGEDFPPNLDNIKGYFDDKLVTLTPTGSTLAGTDTGSVKSNSNGVFTCTFTIPEGVRTGSREVLLKSDIIIGAGEIPWGNSASTVYQAEGIARTIERTVTTVTTILLNKSVTVKKTTYIDPVGQTFVVPEKCLISAAEVYFEAKPDNNASITLEIRGVTNGVINGDILADCTLHANEVSVSSNATVATKFTFDDNPALLDPDTQYAFVLRSESDEYRVWVAEMGLNDIITGNQVKRNPYISGVFLSSSNNAAWTIHQTLDMKFRLYRYSYAMSGTVNFSPVTVNNDTMITVMADQLVPVGTDVRWYYSTDGSNYNEVELGSMINKGVGVDTPIYVRVVLSRTEETNLTPIIALDTVGILAGKFASNGDYIFKNVPNLDDFDEVRVVVEQYVPAGTSLTFYCSVDKNEDGSDIWQLMDQDTSVDVIPRADGWYEYQYYKRVSTTSVRYHSVRMRVHMTSNSTAYSPAIRRYRSIVTESVH